MAEEFRLFLRTALYVAIAGAVYWIVSLEASGTVLLLALLLALAAFVAVGLVFVRGRGTVAPAGHGLLGTLNHVLGLDEPSDAPAPLEGRPERVPLASAWPIVTAAGVILVALGLIYGTWLIVPGVVVMAAGGLGWLTQLDR